MNFFIKKFIKKDIMLIKNLIKNFFNKLEKSKKNIQYYNLFFIIIFIFYIKLFS